MTQRKFSDGRDVLGRRVLWAGAVLSLVAATALGAVRADAQEFGPNLGIIGVTAETQDLGNSGAGVTVGIIDGLADALHFDLNIAVQVVATGGSYVFADAHGSHVAGIVAAQLNGFGTVGVAPSATIISLAPSTISAGPARAPATGSARCRAKAATSPI